MDAVHDFDLPLHWSVQSTMDIRVHTSSSGRILVHVRLWPYGVLLYEKRLFISSLCICPRPTEFVELLTTIRYEDRLPVLLLCSAGHILVHCGLPYDVAGIVKKWFSHLSPQQDRSLRNGDLSTH